MEPITLILTALGAGAALGVRSIRPSPVRRRVLPGGPVSVTIVSVIERKAATATLR